MVPMISMILFVFIGAVNGDGTMVTVEQSITPSFTNGVVGGIEVNCRDPLGNDCYVTEDDKWFLSAQESDTIDDWAIEVDLSDAFALSPGLSKISFTIHGERANGEADMFMGFGDGNDQYISFAVDFDGAMGSQGSPNVKGLLVYPPCGDSVDSLPLGAGKSVSDILAGATETESNAFRAVRDALAGGNRNGWTQFGGERHNNGNSWPVTIEIENDEDANTVTLRFTSENSGDDDLSDGVECVYTGSFGAGEFTFGMLPDLGNENKDNFNIESIDIAVESTGTLPTTSSPTTEPTLEPTTSPTTTPTTEPTLEPTTNPTTEPTAEPTTSPTTEPTAEPTTGDTVVTVEQSITPSFINDDVGGIELDCGDHCQVSGDKWYLSARRSDEIEDWAIEIDLSGAFALSPGLSTISFTIDGARVNDQADMFMGFGDGDQYISFGVDFDGGIGSFGSTNYKGLLVYPPCDSPLAGGSVSDILSNSQQYPGNAFYEVRHALAGGSNDNWRQFGGERHDNGDSWPVTIEMVNDKDADTVTLRFTSEHSGDDDLSEGSVECVYTGTFGAGESSQFTFGMLPDLGNGNDDDFNIESIDIAVTSTESMIIVSNELMTWDAARSWCEDQNLEMLSIHDARDQAAAMAACPTTDNCWIGLYCDENADSHCKNTNDWKWADGSAFDSSYTNWKAGQPNNNGGVQDCILMKGTEDWLWVDFGCNTNTLGLALCDDLSLNAAAHSMSVEGDDGAEHDSMQKPVDDMNPIALTLIGAVVVVVIALLFVMMRGRTKKGQTAKESVAEMSEVVDAPKVVHVADDTVEAPTETAVAQSSIPETTANGMEEVIEVKVNTETV